MADTNWVRASIGLITFTFINLVLFIALSNPFDLIMTAIGSEATSMNVSSQVNPFLNNLRMIFGIVFVLSAVGTIIWFLLGAHSDEYESY